MHFSFKPLYKAAFLLCPAFVLLSSCQQETHHKMPDLPDFDQTYYEHALIVVDEVISQDPDNAEAHYRRAALYLQQNKTNNALASIRRAIELDDDEPVYRLLNAKALLQKGQNREAFQEASSALEAGGPSLELYEILAQASINSNYHNDAIMYTDSALALAPQNSHYLFLRAQALAARKDSVRAEDFFIKSLQAGKHAPDVYEALVEMNMNIGNYEKARQYMEQNLSANKTVGNRLLFQQAQILRRTGNPDSAAVILYRVKDQPDINEFYAMRELMQLYYDQNMLDSALLYADQMLNVRAGDKLALLTKARVWDKKRSYQQAINTYEEILSTDSLQQEEFHKLAASELDYLRGKVAYLWKKQQQEELQKLKKGLAPVQPITPEEQ
ncbi:MAG: tetratricopeptide repeat protein [Cyclobacteriaceae bacterium]